MSNVFIYVVAHYCVRRGGGDFINSSMCIEGVAQT